MTGKKTGSKLVALLWMLAAAGTAPALAADSPSTLRAQMQKAEEEYFALYNRLNTERRYHVICKQEEATGSRLARRRVCQPRYVVQSTERAASERLQAAISAADSAGPANTRGPNVGAAVPAAGPTAEEDEEGFRLNMIEVLRRSPELQALGRRRDELQQRYAEAVRVSGAR